MPQAVKAYKSHRDWILAVAWSPASAHHLVTASQDGTLKLWDLRAAVPLHTVEGHTDKARAPILQRKTSPQQATLVLRGHVARWRTDARDFVRSMTDLPCACPRKYAAQL